jgi:hypothetical protein
VSAVKQGIRCFLVAWMFLQGAAHAQSGPGATSLEASNEIPSFFFGALPSQPRTAGEPYRSAPAQKFVRNAGYVQKLCDEEMAALRKALAKYRAYELGEWT